MRQSQLEIKSIEAELRSIRADAKSSRTVSLLEAEGSKLSLQESLNQLSHQPASIAPTIVRPSTHEQIHERRDERKVEPNVKPKSKREVECFPIALPLAQTQPDAVSQAQLESVIEQLRHYSEAATRSPRRQSSRRQGSHRKQTLQVNAIRQLLEEKAKQINDLSTQQEAAILELMQISGQLNQECEKADTVTELKNELALECEVAEIPYIERSRNGMLVLTNRAIEARTRREQTTKIAKPSVKPPAVKSPRQRQRNHRTGVSFVGRLWRWVTQPVLWLGSATVNAVGVAGAHTRRQYRGSGRRAAASAPEMPVTLTEAATLVISSALLRLLLDWIVASYPMLWIPSILIMITPAAFAIYRATVKPPTGFAWGYRLFAILIGLLLGGRL